MTNADVKLNKIGLVMLGVKDLARAVAFYRDKLGMAVQSEIPNEFAFLNGGGVMLALAVPLSKNSPAMVGATEIVFSVESVRAAHAALRVRHVEFIMEPREVNPPMWAANFTDPDGHRLSIYGPEGKA
jgi:catechol 2,3-dioxygenase-like lactoylglutathione lyase family enzyme